MGIKLVDTEATCVWDCSLPPWTWREWGFHWVWVPLPWQYGPRTRVRLVFSLAWECDSVLWALEILYIERERKRIIILYIIIGMSWILWTSSLVEVFWSCNSLVPKNDTGACTHCDVCTIFEIATVQLNDLEHNNSNLMTKATSRSAETSSGTQNDATHNRTFCTVNRPKHTGVVSHQRWESCVRCQWGERDLYWGSCSSPALLSSLSSGSLVLPECVSEALPW